MNPSDREALARDLVAAAVLRGNFTLRSGQTSTQLTTEPGLLSRIADALVPMIPEGVQRIAGTALGAVPLATALSLRTGLPSLFVRVDAAHSYGTNKSVEGVLEPGDRVLLVEDVVTTGGASLTAVELLQAAGAEVLSVVAVVDRQQGGTQIFGAAGIPFGALFTVSDLGLTE